MFIMAGCAREFILDFFPHGLVTLEIGVQKGHFSDAMLQRMKPAVHYMVDPYVRHDSEDYDLDKSNFEDHEQLYASVLERFAEPLAKGRAVMHRTTSIAAAREFPDGYFDFIYIDAMHFYEAVLLDLFTYSRKLKRGGVLAGHDFTLSRDAVAQKFGVVDAVKEFARETDFSLRCITWEPWSSYFLAGDDSELWPAVMDNLRGSRLGHIEFDDIYRDKIIQEYGRAPRVIA